MRRHQSPVYFLGIIIFVATLIRVVLIWIGRPEFVGWFNHTYYYFVQTRGLIETGHLPYDDMPLLFWLYAGTARVLTWLGVAMQPAIVHATRFWMCLIPSLMAIPVYSLAKMVQSDGVVRPAAWVLIAASTLLPLTVVHLPEFSQKNVLGLLLMAWLLVLLLRVFRGASWQKIPGILALAAQILLTHFGTFIAVAMLSVAVLLSLVSLANWRQGLLAGGSVLVLGTGAWWLIQMIDPDRTARIVHYLLNSVDGSFIGQILSQEASGQAKMAASISVALLLVLWGLLWWAYRASRHGMGEPDRRFLLSQVLFAGLLMLPVLDQLVLARLMVFVALLVMMTLLFVLKYGSWPLAIRKGLVWLAALGCAVMLVGETVSVFLRDRDKGQAYVSLMEMNAEIGFSRDDLIITQNGIEHISNWFLGSSATLIPAFNREDFDTYQTIYLLNPAGAAIDATALRSRTADDEADAYFFMRNPILPPSEAVLVFESEYLTLYRLDSVPEEWVFDEDGSWKGYGR